MLSLCCRPNMSTQIVLGCGRGHCTALALARVDGVSRKFPGCQTRGTNSADVVVYQRCGDCPSHPLFLCFAASSAANVPALSESSLGGSAMDVEQGPTGAPAMVPATPPPAAASQGFSSVASAAAGRSEEASSGSLPPLSMAQSGSAVLPPFAPSPLPTPSDGATAVGAHPSSSLGGTLPSLASSTAGQATQGSAAAAGGLPPLVSPALQGATPAVTVEQGSVAPFGQGAGGGAADPTVQVNKSKCWSCKKKVGLTGFECKCAYVFCAAHRHADTHNVSRFSLDSIRCLPPYLRACLTLALSLSPAHTRSRTDDCPAHAVLLRLQERRQGPAREAEP